MEEKSVAPALSRGLTVLEIVAKEVSISFTELKERMGLHATTLNRLLKVLVEREYLRKDQYNRYTLGLNLLHLSRQETFWNSVVDKLDEPMQLLNKKYGMTVLLVAMENAKATVVYKILEASNLGMLEEGTIREDLYYFPWGILYLAEQEPATREAIINHSHQHNIGNMQRLTEEEETLLMDEALMEGFVDDRGLYFSGRRFAVPIHMSNGQLIGALCMGCNGDYVQEINVTEMIQDMKKTVNLIKL